MNKQYPWTGPCDTPAVERWAIQPKKFRLRRRHKVAAILTTAVSVAACASIASDRLDIAWTIAGIIGLAAVAIAVVGSIIVAFHD